MQNKRAKTCAFIIIAVSLHQKKKQKQLNPKTRKGKEIMTKYIYKGEEISHTRFITICQMAGIMGGRKKSHYQKLVEMAEQGNEKAADILGNLEVKNV
jgi:hypothetical protein